ncbi:MAG: leucine-rich repeat protein, partial [Clostridia bacterium]|nr:leucine-rich repeat protein [Clostridia bacterium]
NAPYLAFFGDWTEAPMFDKTYYEVESQAHDASIDDEDKLKADYYATTPYGSYFYNYIIPLGTFLYDLDTTVYDAIPATEDHIAISDMLGCIDGISAVYAGLLRGAKEMEFTITDKITGEVVYDHTDYNANKAFSQGGTPIPYYEFLKISSRSIGLVNNRQYEFKMQGKLDFGEDGGLSTNVRNSFSFDFYLDNEAPIIKEAFYEKEYDDSLKKDRFYLTLTVYDNQYVQSISPIAFTSSSSYAFLSDNSIPVYSTRGTDNKVRFEITDYLDALYSDELIGSALAFSIDDYALNSNIYICQLPGTRGDFKFTSNGKASGRPLNVINAYVGDVIDLTEYLYSTDATLDDDKDYLKYLVWSTYNTSVIKADVITKEFKNGEAVCLKAGKTQVTVTEMMDGKQATVTINVKEREAVSSTRKGIKRAAANVNDAELESVDFIYFDTVFAYSRAAQTSEIGDTGDRVYVSSLSGGVSFYPGEKIKLSYAVKPWYVEDSREFSYESTNTRVAIVDEDGTVTALKEGTSIIILNVKGSNIKARIRVTVKSEFIIENRMLVAYKGLGGEVVIPDDEGILYIGAYAFCLYDTDRSIELTEDDYDANKIPAMNTSVTKVVIPYGVEDVQKYAFYNCSGLTEVVLPETVKFVREYSFYKDEKLTKINLDRVEVVGAHAFHGCKKLENVDLTKCYSIGASGFEGCETLTEVDLTHLRNATEETVRVTGGFNVVGRTFKDCTALAIVKMNKDTKLCREMFVNTAIKSVDIYAKNVPTYAFARSSKLEKVVFHNDVLTIDLGAFCQSPLLATVEFKGSVDSIGSQAFYADEKLTSFTLPDSAVEIGDYCFMDTAITTLVLKANTVIKATGALAFDGTQLTTFTVAADNKNYAVDGDGALLVSKDGKTVILAAHNKDFGNFTLDAKYEKVASGAFAGVQITSVTFANKDIVIGDYAFNQCEELTKVVFNADIANSTKAYVGERAFNGCTELAEVENLDKLKNVGDYGFANTGLTEITLGANATFGEGAFFQSKVTEVTIGANSTFGMGVFQNCTALTTVNMPAAGGVHFGADCFAMATALREIDLSKTDGEIENETFYGCTSLTKVDLAGVKTVGAYAFADCSALANVINAMSVETIGEGAFSRQSQNGSAPIFDRIALDSVKEIGMGAFMGNAGLLEITIPATVTKIDGFTFAFCSSLQRVVLPETVTEIGMYAFRGCGSLTSINLNKVKTFGEYSFYDTSFLVTVNLAASETVGANAFENSGLVTRINANHLTYIGDSAFSHTSMSVFNAPNVKYIGRAAFYKNYLLSEFVFGSDIEYVGPMAFLGCLSLQQFAYGADKATTGEINGYATLSDKVLYTKMPSGKFELKAVPGGMTDATLTVMDGTVRIDIYAGNRNTNITKIVLPDSLKTIGNYAFNGYTKLAEVEFNSYTAPVLETQYYPVNAEAEKDYFPTAELAEDAPGYQLLHNQFNLFGYELYYYTFKGLAGSLNPIRMVLSANATDGYDGAVYEACFGKVDYASRTEYVSMDANTVTFLDNAEKVAALKGNIVLSDAKVINSAITALNAMTQDLTEFGYSRDEADALIKAVRDAKTTLTELQVGTAGRDFKNILSKLNSLSDNFSVSQIDMLREINGEINTLTSDEKILLAYTDEYKKFSALLEKYNEYVTGNEYVNSVIAEGDEAANAAISAFAYSAAAVAATVSLLSVAAYAAKKRLGL